MKRLTVSLAVVLGIGVMVLLGLSFLFDANRFKPMLESNLTSALNRDAKLGDLKLSIFSGGIAATNFSISDDSFFSKSPFLRAKRVTVGLELLPLIFSRKLLVTNIDIDAPDVTLLQNASGVWNVSSLGTKSPEKSSRTAAPSGGEGTLDLSVKGLSITNGRLALGRVNGHSKPLVFERMNMQVQNFSSNSAFPFLVSALVAGGGEIHLEGNAGPLNAADALMVPFRGKVRIKSLDLAGSGLNDFAQHIAGILSLDGNAESTGSAVNITGRITGERLKLAKGGTPARTTVAFDFAAQHNVRNHSGVLNRGDVHIGKAAANFTGTYAEQGNSMILRTDLSGSNMPLTELEGMLPALGIVLPAGSSLRGGAVDAKISSQGPADKLVTEGTLTIRETKLAGFDLIKKLSVIEQLAGMPAAGPDTEIQSAAANARITSEGTNVENITVIVPTLGELHGSGTITPTDRLDFRMNAMLHSAGLSVLGNTAIPLKIQGSSSDPVFSLDAEALAKAEIKSLKSNPGSPANAATSFLKGLLTGKKK